MTLRLLVERVPHIDFPRVCHRGLSRAPRPLERDRMTLSTRDGIGYVVSTLHL